MYIRNGLGDAPPAAPLATAVLDPCAPDGPLAPLNSVIDIVKQNIASGAGPLSTTDPRVLAALAQIPASCYQVAITGGNGLQPFVLAGYMKGPWPPSAASGSSSASGSGLWLGPNVSASIPIPIGAALIGGLLLAWVVLK